MKYRENCWEYHNCGRAEKGRNEEKEGVCPALCAEQFNGMNHGKKGGRICWSVSGTLCCKKTTGLRAQGKDSCMTCGFFLKVREQEGDSFMLISPAIEEVL